MPKPKPDSEKVAKRVALTCQQLFKDGELAMRLAFEGQSPLRARNYAAGRTGKGIVSNATADAACARVGRERDPYDEMVRAINDLYNDALRVSGFISRQLAGLDPHVPTPTEVRRMSQTHKRGAGTCTACGVEVSGEGEDRVKSGMCPKHYRAQRRSPLTRSEFILEKRQETDRQRRADGLEPLWGLAMDLESIEAENP